MKPTKPKIYRGKLKKIMQSVNDESYKSSWKDRKVHLDSFLSCCHLIRCFISYFKEVTSSWISSGTWKRYFLKFSAFLVANLCLNTFLFWFSHYLLPYFMFQIPFTCVCVCVCDDGQFCCSFADSSSLNRKKIALIGVLCSPRGWYWPLSDLKFKEVFAVCILSLVCSAQALFIWHGSPGLWRFVTRWSGWPLLSTLMHAVAFSVQWSCGTI